MKALETAWRRSPEATGEKNDKMTLIEGFSPAGLKVLVVDDDPVCLMILETMLRQCNYAVTTCQRASKALSLLRENKSAFDLVMSDVYMPDMDGFKLLEAIGLELDLPVIMMSANGETDVVMKGITHGACDYLLKPVRIEELRNIWQHVIRRRGRGEVVKDDQSGDWDEINKGLDSPSECDGLSRKRKDKQELADEQLDDVNSLKKARVVWSVELHQQFVNAVNQLGIDKAVPKRILEIMNVQGLSRENVASHLQKYRQYLKRLSGVSTQPYPVASFQAGQSGNFGGSMQIQPGGRSISATSGGKGMNLPVTSPSVGILRRGLGQIDASTLSTLAQLQAHQQSQAGIVSSHLMGGMSQLQGANTGLGTPSSGAPFVGLQHMSSLELDLLMKAAQQDSFARQQSGTINGENIGGMGVPRNSLPPLPICLSNFKREDDQGVALNQVGPEKFSVDIGNVSSFGSSIKGGLQDRVLESTYNTGFADLVDNFAPASPSDVTVAVHNRAFPYQTCEKYGSQR